MVVAGLFVVSIPAHKAEATLTADAVDTLHTQLSAISDYITRTFAPEDQTSLTNSELRAIVSLGSVWLINAQEENGHFRYEYAPYDDEYAEDDNIVRQAGALYELGEIARRDEEDTLKTAEAIERAMDYFEALTREDIYNDMIFSCITINSVSNRCKLGATSLALSGLLGYLEQNPDRIPEYQARAESYISYILAMKKPNAGFRNKYRIGESAQSEAESSFSNGEALLALVRYYQLNPHEDIKEAIDETFAYLRDEPYDTALYLWIMAALKDMKVLWSGESETYATYTRAFTDWRIDSVLRFRNTNKNLCAYAEGIVSAYSVLDGETEEDKLQELRNEIDFWNTKNGTLQLSESDRYRVVMENDTLILKAQPKPEQAFGGFLTSDTALSQRIDFTQHCISSYLQTLVDIEGETL